MRLHPFSTTNVNKAEMSSWQKPKSSLVTTLSKEADVFSLAYSQNASLDTIANLPEVVGHVRQLKKLGYRDIVLVGHSIGGVLARHLVEDHPELGVTKVIQVASPNAGSSWAKATWGVRKNQEAFLESITHEGREKTLTARKQKKIPEGRRFRVRGVPDSDHGGRGRRSRQSRGGSHFEARRRRRQLPLPVVSGRASARHPGHRARSHALHGHARQLDRGGLVHLIREAPGRWNAEQVNGARMKILGPTKIVP